MKALGQIAPILWLLVAAIAAPAIGPEHPQASACADCAADTCPDCDQCAGCTTAPVSSPAVFPCERVLEDALATAPCWAPADEPICRPRLNDIFHPPKAC